jgi:hypothetical protein
MSETHCDTDTAPHGPSRVIIIFTVRMFDKLPPFRPLTSATHIWPRKSGTTITDRIHRSLTVRQGTVRLNARPVIDVWIQCTVPSSPDNSTRQSNNNTKRQHPYGRMVNML